MDNFERIGTIEHGGHSFAVEWAPDSYQPAPWDDCDGHGPVSNWRPVDYAGRVPTAPGERVLYRDGSRYGGPGLVYDVAEAQRIALRDGWGIGEEALAALARKLGREPTRREIAAESVRLDMEYLRGWCCDDWCYMTTRVTLLDAEGEPTAADAYLGGIESMSEAYALDMAADLAADILAQLPPAPTCSHCGSADVRADAWAVWNHAAGAWVLDADSTATGNAYCVACDSETSLNWEGV